MSSVKIVCVVSLFILAVRSGKDLWKLECPPTVGIFAETTVIRCYFKDIKDIEIVAVYLTKVGEDEPLFSQEESKRSGDQRFSLENSAKGPSLKISKTMFSDEGEYLYHVITDSGFKKIKLSISVTAKYKDPVTSTWPEKVMDRGPVSLYCNATDGFPAGTINWFDQSGNNWTSNSVLTKDPKDNGSAKSVALSSKLTFKSIFLEWGPFRCIVYNSKYVKVGENYLNITPVINEKNMVSSASNTKSIVAVAIVIGSLIVGLLFALLFFRKRNHTHRRPSANPILSYEQGNGDDPEK
ncbi:uncharacterized protein LOC128015501 isoform X1 [Carassius gibelio]|uniref:uncharacterized protein LOC128015501 isoform X1 n=1 Tax=Carassius gibelio TaxID=101364 RepID=UPI0022791D4F|nr:uncharacterized protein LOC128015501 isoform X1 [Carassius gibelio]